MASFLTLPQELRDIVIDLLLLTNNAPPTNVPEYHAYQKISPSSKFPHPKKHQAAGLYQASHSLRDEILRRSSSLQLGLHYTLRVVIYRRERMTEFSGSQLKLEPRLRWKDVPIISATNIERFDIEFELNDLLSWGWVQTTRHRGFVGSLLERAVSVLVRGRERSNFQRTISKINIEVTAKESQTMTRIDALKVKNASEILEKILSQGAQEFADFCIATAIKYNCLRCVNLVEYTDARPASFLPAPRNMFWTQIGSISLQAGTARPSQVWYVDRKLLDRMREVDDPKYHEVVSEILLRRERGGLDRESKLAEDHYEDPESVALMGNLDKGNYRADIGVCIYEILPGKGYVKRKYIRTRSVPVKFDDFFDFWKRCRGNEGIVGGLESAWRRYEHKH